MHNNLSILAIKYIQYFIIVLENCMKQVGITRKHITLTKTEKN